jgi:hypothetical protein
MIKRIMVVALVSLMPILSAVADNDPHAAAADAMGKGQSAMQQANAQLDQANKQADAAMADAKKQVDDAMGRIDGAKAAGDAKKAKAINDSHAAMKAGSAQADAVAAAHSKH